MNVRRLAAVDMWGTRGTLLRRRVVLAEFFLAWAGGIAAGLWLILSGPDVTLWVLGALAVGIGLNYAPLAIYAVRFMRPGALDAELSDVDVPAELRRYSTWQMWLILPFSFVVFDLRYRRHLG